jgi:uncharacterized protein YycO
MMKKSFSILIIFIIAGCLARTIVKKPEDEYYLAQNRIIFLKIDSLAHSGDWLVTRGYHMSDNIVANATAIPISHAAIFDKENQQVIEADNSGIHKTPVSDFIDKSYRVLIIRPRWQKPSNAKQALQNAYTLIGKDYDFLGILGLDVTDKYYCSELAVYIYKDWRSPEEKLPKVIKPGELYLFGTILYDSLPRDEM